MAINPVALTWFAHRRTQGLCERLGWKYVVIDTRSKGLLRYIKLVPRTAFFLLVVRPRILVVQSPSIVLAILCLVLRPLSRYRLVVDAHNESVRPYILTSRLAKNLVNLCLKKADLTIVTNRALAQVVESAGGHAYVLPDPIPALPTRCSGGAQMAGKGFRVVVISTFAEDEPIDEVLRAASGLPGDIEFFITGNSLKLAPEVRAMAGINVRFTGFLPESDYWALLEGCSIIVDLTRMPDCLVCGAYEAMAVEKPLILTDGSAAREWFGDAAAYIDNSADALVRAVLSIREDYRWKVEALVRQKERMEGEWMQLGARLGLEFTSR